MVAEIGNFQYMGFELDSWVVETFVVGFLLFCPQVPFQSIGGEFFCIRKALHISFLDRAHIVHALPLQVLQDNIRGLSQLFRNFPQHH